jgi:septal ring factor EnvC (AmiA/AmiB activator)
MTPRQETSLERSVGRIEAQLESVTAALGRVDQKLDAADDWRHEVRERLEKMEARSAHMDHVSSAFAALQQSIRDGKMQGKGVLIGIGIAGGAGGAAVATFFKGLWASIMGS